ncbi:ATP-binding protein [Halobacillus salinarum]|uniref:histidine kinase n=1 Tax=Halobacillus salinarum TaxID=2932257 RepID=A0ABY4ES99_9BACI|nr:ATP-binding protein [Halobacillus salinarum]UOQ46529.1 ATP-binding protein [Halobacillus salinarum]
MIRERYSDHVHSGEILDVLSLNGTPACLVDLRLQLVMLNQEMQELLQLDETEKSFSEWITAFRIFDQSEIHKMLHQFMTEQTRESSVHISTRNSLERLLFKGVHLSNGQIIMTISPDQHQQASAKEIHENYGSQVPLDYKHPSAARMQTLHLSNPKDSQFKHRITHLVDKFPHGIALLNYNWDVLYANPKMEELTGVKFKENYGRKLWEVHSIAEYYLFFQHILRAMETQTTVEFEGFIGETKSIVHMTVHPMEQGITVFAKDITKDKQHLQALKDSEERFNMLANNIKDVMWICDSSLENVYYLSPSFKKMFGMARRNVPSVQTVINKAVHEEDRALVNESFNAMKKERVQLDYRVKHPTGDIKWIRTKGFPLRSDEKCYVVGIHEDITEFKEMIKLRERSQQLSTITQMSAGIAHEIKNPLTAIKGFLQIGAANPALRDNYQDIILDEVNRIESIVQDFMMLSKPKSSIQLEEVELKQVIDYVTRLLQGEADTKKVRLFSSCHFNEHSIYTEPKRLKQILLNIVKNALEAVEVGGEVQINGKQLEDELTLSVIDNGQGLTEQELAKIGEPFFTTKEKGTGLGVMVTKKMVEDLNGSIYFESEKGKGTEVTVVLPKVHDSEY